MPYLTGKLVSTICAIYAGTDKKQMQNLTKLPAGVVGVVKGHDTSFGNTEVCLVRFYVHERKYYARVAPHILEVIADKLILC